MIPGFAANGFTGARLGRKIQAVADVFEQPRLEAPQRRLDRGLGAQLREGCLVLVEQLGVRVVTGQQLEQQLIEIERTHQPRRGQRQDRSCILGSAQ